MTDKAGNPPSTAGRLSEKDLAGLHDVVSLWEQHAEQLERSMAEVVKHSPELAPVLQPGDTAAAARRAQRRELLKDGLRKGDIGEYLEATREQARTLAAQGVKFSAVVGLITGVAPLVDEMLVEAYAEDRPRLARALAALERLVGLVVGTMGAEYTQVRETLLEEAHRSVLRELTVPVVPIWQGVLVVPLVGVLDSTRARQMTERLLDEIVERRAQVAIVDITGVPAVDTQVADYLIRAVKAARLLGTASVLVGIRPAIAQTLVHLGVDLRDVQTEANLQTGLEYAFRVLGFRIERELGRG
ncbi:MAG: STAS domain-containing protein [Bacillota bacterium]